MDEVSPARSSALAIRGGPDLAYLHDWSHHEHAKSPEPSDGGAGTGTGLRRASVVSGHGRHPHGRGGACRGDAGCVAHRVLDPIHEARFRALRHSSIRHPTNVSVELPVRLGLRDGWTGEVSVAHATGRRLPRHPPPGWDLHGRLRGVGRETDGQPDGVYRSRRHCPPWVPRQSSLSVGTNSAFAGTTMAVAGTVPGPGLFGVLFPVPVTPGACLRAPHRSFFDSWHRGGRGGGNLEEPRRAPDA